MSEDHGAETAHAPASGQPSASDETPANGAPQRTPEPAARGTARAAWYILLVALLLIAGAGYYWVSKVFPVERQALAAQLEALDETLGGVEARLAAADAALAGAAERHEALASRFGALDRAQNDLAEAVQALYARDAQVSLDWVLAEVEYLVFAAVQRLALEHDTASAEAALQAADRRIRVARDPDLRPLREQLTRDIAALEAVPEPDTEGLALWLADAATRVDDLPTRPIADLDTSFANLREEEVAAANWQDVARALWRDVVSLVQVKDGELSDDVLFDPKLRYFLQQNLRLELASARLAVLRRDAENLRAAAALVTALLERYYDLDDAGVQAIIARLESASEVELNPALPDISGSLDAVRALRAELGERVAETPAATP